MLGNLSFLYRSPVMLAIDEALEAQAKLEPPRTPSLGMGVIGDPCERKIWYGLRFKRSFEAKTLRIFKDGQDGELLMAERLRMAGLTITDQQILFSDFENRFRGRPDGKIVLNNKTHIWQHSSIRSREAEGMTIRHRVRHQ